MKRQRLQLALALTTTTACVVFAAHAGAVRNPPIPTPIGLGPRFHPPALSPAVVDRRSLAGLRCRRSASPRFGVHLELFAHGRVVLVPAGIGVAIPWTRPRPHVVAGSCSYAARTTTPTGVIEVERGRRLTLARFFSIWGQPLRARRLAGFTAAPGRRVRAYVGGRRWRGPLGDIPLLRHAEIVLEVGEFIPPHTTYVFWKGL